jgi:hypothetical protein
VKSLGDGLLARLDFVDIDVGDPVDWIEDRLGAVTWSRQQDIARSVRKQPRVAVQASHSVGKSWLAARIAAWWIDSHPIGDAFVLSTAPSQAQVDAILWRELRRAHAAADLPGRLTAGAHPRWLIGDELVALGRKSADMANADEAAASLQGIHARYLLLLIDEAAGVPPWVWDAFDSMATNEHARILAIGNPTDPESRFAQVCAPGSGWHVEEVSAFDTPAFTGEEVPADLAEQLVSAAWVERMRKQWGEGSARWTARVLGQFPDEADDTLISRRLIKAAQERSLPLDTPGSPGAFGCDIARAGGDETVAYLNRGGVVRLVHRSQGHELMRTTGAIMNLLRDAAAPGWPAIVDAIGIGAGVHDRLREQGARVFGFVSSHKARRADRFVNRRAEVFWDLREAMREGLIDLDPADEELASQLGAIRFHEDSRGRIQIERKAQMKARGVSSPDRADALAMTFATGAWRPARVLSDEERRRIELDEAVARAERVQRARAWWPEAPADWEGGPVMAGILDLPW